MIEGIESSSGKVFATSRSNLQNPEGSISEVLGHIFNYKGREPRNIPVTDNEPKLIMRVKPGNFEQEDLDKMVQELYPGYLEEDSVITEQALEGVSSALVRAIKRFTPLESYALLKETDQLNVQLHEVGGEKHLYTVSKNYMTTLEEGRKVAEYLDDF